MLRRTWVCMLLLAICLGCAQERLDHPPFAKGDLVRLRVDDSQVQVMRIDYDSWLGRGKGWRVLCRIGNPAQQRQDGLFSSNTEIVAYTAKWFYPYELAQFKEPTDLE